MSYKTYYYDGQIRRYLLQFVDIFSGLKVRTGYREDGKTPIDITVPIHYGTLDRMVAYCLAGGADSETTSQSLPIMNAWMLGINYAPERAKSSAIVDRRTYITVEDNLNASSQEAATSKIKVKSRAMPSPYTLSLELSLLSENQDQQFQMLEQILMVFNPSLEVQSNDSPWDWTALTDVTLRDIGLETAFPAGEAESLISTTLAFEMPIWISGPMKQDINRFVAGIKHVIRDGTLVADPLTTLVVPGLEQGAIPAGTLNDGTAIPLIGVGPKITVGTRLGTGSTLNDLWNFAASPLEPCGASNSQIWVDGCIQASEFIILNASNIEINASGGQAIELRTFIPASAGSPGASDSLVCVTEDELGLDSGHVFSSDVNVP